MTTLFSQDLYYPDFNIIENNNTHPENLFIHTMSSSGYHMAILDTDLYPNWYINSGDHGFDFKPNNDKLSYFKKNNSFWIIMDEYMNEVDTLSNPSGFDYHDINILPNDNLLVFRYDSSYVDMSALVEDGSPFASVVYCVIEEYDSNHNLLHSWNGLEELDITEYVHIDLTTERIAWMHVNSLEVDEEGDLLISDRRSSQILKINWPEGNLIWTLGGEFNEFTFINDSLSGPRLQHDARLLENGNIMMFDNHVMNQINQSLSSRVVEYQLDEENFTAELVWEYSHPQEYLGVAMGSAQRLSNHNTLINWGLVNGYGTLITEVDYDKNIVLDIQYPNGYQTYKVRKSDWIFEENLIIGDANSDSIVDILDVMYLVNYILYNEEEDNAFHLFKLDINKDRLFDVNDILLIIDIVLN